MTDSIDEAKEALVLSIAQRFAKRRTHGAVYMGGEHNPTPAEMKDAREVVDDALAYARARAPQGEVKTYDSTPGKVKYTTNNDFDPTPPPSPQGRGEKSNPSPGGGNAQVGGATERAAGIVPQAGSTPSRAPESGVAPRAVDLIAAERRRQVEREGWTPEHDDSHRGELRVNAARLAVDGTDYRVVDEGGDEDDSWGLVGKHGYRGTKPDEIRALVIAGALIVAEIERLQRAAAIRAKGGAA